MLRFLSKIKEIYSPCLVCKSKTDQLGKGCTLRNVFICSHEKWDEKRVFVRNLQLSLQFPLRILCHITVLSLVASRARHSTQPVSRSYLAELDFF